MGPTTLAERRAARGLHRLEAVYARVHAALAALTTRREVYDEELAAVIDEARARTQELKQRARLEVAARVGREDATALYRTPTWPHASE